MKTFSYVEKWFKNIKHGTEETGQLVKHLPHNHDHMSSSLVLKKPWWHVPVMHTHMAEIEGPLSVMSSSSSRT